MRIAFYAPLKAPGHPVPSGDRRMAGLLVDALRAAGHEVDIASTLRSFEGAGDAARQAAIRAKGEAEAAALIERYTAAATRPEAWFTYHLYHKAPDWLGPAVSAALGIPYLVAEASSAPKQATGPWAAGHAAAAAAIAGADAVLAVNSDDIACLRPLVGAPERLIALRPFLDPAPFQAARGARAAHRKRLAAALGLDAGVPWLLAVGMMRPGDKLASYRQLAAALGHLGDTAWRLVVVGAGLARGEVVALLDGLGGNRIAYAGELDGDALPGIYAAADIFAWPAVNEAYGLALLEAQAAGTPVVAGRVRGVVDIVADGETGFLTPPGDDAAFAGRLRALLADPDLRGRLGANAADRVARHHGMTAASATLADALAIARRAR
jgi:glycosyltransferase involved in cell wall biosynthesis